MGTDNGGSPSTAPCDAGEGGKTKKKDTVRTFKQMGNKKKAAIDIALRPCREKNQG